MMEYEYPSFAQSLWAAIFSLVMPEAVGGGLVNPNTALISSLAVGVTPLTVKVNLSMYCRGGRSSHSLCLQKTSTTRLSRPPSRKEKGKPQRKGENNPSQW